MLSDALTSRPALPSANRAAKLSTPICTFYSDCLFNLAGPAASQRGSTRRLLLGDGRAGDAQRQVNRRGNLVLVLTLLDVEILAVDGEVGADDQQVALEIRDARAQFIFQV